MFAQNHGLIAVCLAAQCLLTSGSDCGEDVSFLQAELRLASRSALKPIGRSFFSEDPKHTAAWWLRYTYSEAIEEMLTVGAGSSTESAAVVVKKPKGPGVEKMYFLKVPDWKSPVTELSMRDFVRAAKSSWRSVMEKEQLYTPWTDFHDGHLSQTVRFGHLAEDNLPYQLYYEGKVGRAYLPKTTWTIEHRGSEWDVEDLDYEAQVTTENPDKCRNTSTDEFPKRTFWKSTFFVTNATAAREFALDVLHGTVIENPYPWPREPGCIAVQWVSLHQASGEAFQLHFVEDFVYDTVLHSIPEFLQYQRDFMKTAPSGCISSFMMNNLILETESLDPFAQRLDELSVPYLAFEVANRYGILFSFPGNEGVTLQLQSSHLSYVAPQPVQICS